MAGQTVLTLLLFSLVAWLYVSDFHGIFVVVAGCALMNVARLRYLWAPNEEGAIRHTFRDFFVSFPSHCDWPGLISTQVHSAIIDGPMATRLRWAFWCILLMACI